MLLCCSQIRLTKRSRRRATSQAVGAVSTAAVWARRLKSRATRGEVRLRGLPDRPGKARQAFISLVPPLAEVGQGFDKPLSIFERIGEGEKAMS